MKNNFLYGVATAAVLLSIVAGSCGRTKKSETVQVRKPRTFLPAIVPGNISEASERINYFREHYWDNLDFTDSLYFAEIDTISMIDAFVGYLSTLEPGDGASIAALMKRAGASKTAFEYFGMLADEVLYDPNSPWRNDELYIPVLEAQIESPLLDEYEKIAPAHRLKYANQNRVGRKANDFRYTTADGRSASLYGLKAEYLLLFFNNPGCPMCKGITEAICASPLLYELIESGRLKVLAVYPDNYLDEWFDYLPEMPAAWINSYDNGCVITEKGLYDMKAIPSLYLLDAEKRVIVKDSTDVQYIETVLISLAEL